MNKLIIKAIRDENCIALMSISYDYINQKRWSILAAALERLYTEIELKGYKNSDVKLRILESNSSNGEDM